MVLDHSFKESSYTYEGKYGVLPMNPNFGHHALASSDDVRDNQSYKCNVLHSNHTTIILHGEFEGIPQNLIINLVTWLILLILFTLLRKKAWDYGRLALVHKNDQRWTQLFYGEGTAATNRMNNEEDSVDSVEITLHLDKGIFSWLRALFQIKDEHILKRNGPDAIQYLSFQRHIIVYLFIICLICLCIILPVNYQGTLVDEGNSFGSTTLSNLDPETPLLWVHVAFSFLFIPLGILIMRHFSVNLKLEEDDNVVGRTLMISGVPKDHCDRNFLLQHFQEAYPECVVQDVQFAYDVRQLSKLDRQRETATRARIYCENDLKETGIRPKMRPYPCGQFCICSKCPQVDALEYYTEEEHALSTAVDREKSVSLLRPLGIAFVTFQTEVMAELVYKDHQKRCKCTANPPSSSLTRRLNPHDWAISFSPSPEDIYWENLSVKRSLWYTKAIFVNLLLFILFFFLTTPTIVLSYFDVLNMQTVKDLLQQTPILSEFFSTLLLLMVSVVLPVIVTYSDQFMSHWTRSARNHSIMVKTFVFLLFMVVILPLLQLTSVKAFLEWTITKGQAYRWRCVFLSGNGAFFVNYVITASFIGTALELIRFPELFMYGFYMCFSRSRAEHAGLRKAIIWEFEFGVQYAWFLLIFSVVIIFSLLCPLIAPFGVVYMCLKHLNDRYNIYFVYNPSKINRSIHAAAINFVVIALILMQICLFFFLYVRNGWINITVVSLGICMFTVMVFMTQISFHWFRVLSPISYKKLPRKNSAAQSESQPMPSVASASASPEQPFVPIVLKKSSSKDVFLTSSQERSYGTNEDSVNSTPEDEILPLSKADYNSSDKPYQRF